eukprot:2391993-Pleurochrysis_carterae.AAC.1
MPGGSQQPGIGQGSARCFARYTSLSASQSAPLIFLFVLAAYFSADKTISAAYSSGDEFDE